MVNSYIRVLFSHFEEMIKSPTLREWLGWDSDECTFRNAANLETMYSLISETIDDEGEIIDPKLSAHTILEYFLR